MNEGLDFLEFPSLTFPSPLMPSVKVETGINLHLIIKDKRKQWGKKTKMVGGPLN